MHPGDRLTLTVEKPAAGGRMIARHDGAIVLVAAAIPGEVVEAVVEKVQRGTAWARTTKVIEPSADRVAPVVDGACGGSVLAHVRYDRQLALKRDILRDAFARIGRMTLPGDAGGVEPSPVDGYRMRARFHVQQGRVGFFKEGTHELCDPGSTRQLLPATLEAIRRLEAALAALGSHSVVEIELAENRPADERAIHLDLARSADPSRLGTLPAIEGVTGLSCGEVGSARAITLSGSASVVDRLVVPAVRPIEVTLQHHVRSFFQGNRYLLPALMAEVVDEVPAGRVLDLYAGVGVFAVALGIRGDTEVVAIEGDRSAAADLKRNAAAAGEAVTVRRQSVEAFLASLRCATPDTAIVDPPRTGLSREAIAALIALQPSRLVYVSCDVATLARDARILVEAGYDLRQARGFDLFPHTAHLETVVVLDR